MVGEPTTGSHAATRNYVIARHGIPYYCSVQRDTDVSIAKDATYNVAWEALNTDANQRAYSWNSNGLYPPAGAYTGYVVVEVRQGSVANSRFTIELMVNGAGQGWGTRMAMNIATGYFRASCPVTFSTNAGDYVGAHVIAHDDACTLTFARLILTGPLEVEQAK